MVKINKKIALIFILLLLVVFSYGKFAVNSNKNIAVSDMDCRLSSQKTNDCSGTPVLENGSLRISGNNLFELNGHYNACFHIEDIIVKGRYQTTEMNDSLQLELLGKQIQGNQERTEVFPKTIGLVKLNKRTLEGVFVDIWATIRAQNNSLENVPSLSVVCQLL